MEPWGAFAGTFGIILGNALILSLRFFARSQGLEVRWWSRCLARERAHVRALAKAGARCVVEVEVVPTIARDGGPAAKVKLVVSEAPGQ